jgi:hypothetical protein
VIRKCKKKEMCAEHFENMLDCDEVSGYDKEKKGIF